MKPTYVAVRSRRTGGPAITVLFVDDDPAQARREADWHAAMLRSDPDVEELTVTELTGDDET